MSGSGRCITLGLEIYNGAGPAEKLGFFDLYVSISLCRLHIYRRKKKRDSSRSPCLYWFPIGTISKVKKIVRFCDDKVIKARSAHQIYLYVLQHIFGDANLALRFFGDVILLIIVLYGWFADLERKTNAG